MFTIGEFSRVSRVSVRMLRYYDQLGLLKPSQTDRLTSYRYYSADQLPRLNRILALQDLGCPQAFLTSDHVHKLIFGETYGNIVRGQA